MRTLLAAGILVASAPAFADDCDFTDAAAGTGATVLAEQMDAGCVPGEGCPARVIPPPPRARHGAFAGGEATVGTLGEARSDGEALSAGELAASGRAGWHAGLQVCGRTSVIAGTETRGDTAFHLAFPWPFVEAVSMGFEQQWQLRPRLDSSRIYLRRLYSSTEVQTGAGVVVWAHPDGGSAAVLPVRIDLMQRDQDRTGAALETYHFAMFESTHPDRRTEILPITVTDMYPHGPGTDAAPLPSSATLARVDAVALTRQVGGVTVEASGGALFATHAIALPVAGSLGLGWGPWSVRAERAAYLAMDDSITIEDRLAAAYHQGMWRAAAFAALTHTSSEPHPQLTGGGSAGVDVALPEQVKLALDVEVARSYYARLDGDPAPTPQLAEVGTVKLERHFNVNPTAH